MEAGLLILFRTKLSKTYQFHVHWGTMLNSGSIELHNILAKVYIRKPSSIPITSQVYRRRETIRKSSSALSSFMFHARASVYKFQYKRSERSSPFFPQKFSVPLMLFARKYVAEKTSKLNLSRTKSKFFLGDIREVRQEQPRTHSLSSFSLFSLSIAAHKQHRAVRSRASFCHREG